VPYSPSNFPAVPDVSLNASTAHLHGGDLSFITLINGSALHVYGTDLEQVGDYAVYGNFVDGSPINLLIANFGQIVLHEVPEPASLGLLALPCLLAIIRRPNRVLTS
jgi:hypothetical protein